MKPYILISLVLLSMTMASSQEIQISQSNNVIDRIVNMDLPTAKDFNNNTDNVNSSDFWDNLNTTNTTQFENNGGVLNILESWLTTFFDSLFSGKTTDDLTEGTTNLYDNQSWNQSLGDSLYSTGAHTGNLSFNQSHTDTLYSSIIWGYNQTIPANAYTDTQASTNDLHLHNLLNITGVDDNACTGTDKIINVTFDNGNLKIVCGTDESGGTDTQKTTNNFYLYNDTTTIFFNETQLNNTIDARDSDTIYTNGSGISLVGTELNHTDTSSQASSDNSGNTFIQDIILDTFGHLTSVVTAIVEITNIFDQSLNTTDDVIFNSVNATNWGNVTILESQISDLSHVTDGSINSSSWNQSGSNVFLRDTNNNVGIGTTTPSEKLEVNGNLNISNGGNLTVGSWKFWETSSGSLRIGKA